MHQCIDFTNKTIFVHVFVFLVYVSVKIVLSYVPLAFMHECRCLTAALLICFNYLSVVDNVFIIKNIASL